MREFCTSSQIRNSTTNLTLIYIQPFVSDLPDKGWKVEDGYFYAYTGHPKFATVLSIPVLLSFILLIPHWLKVEKTSERRLKTLILLLLQVWPQYRVIKLLIVLFQDREEQQKYHAKKAEHDKNITCLGKSITVFFVMREYFLYQFNQKVTTDCLSIVCTC